ncbi:hypothetical protein [Galbibacter pacificus]|uniref:Uncharacterized protein n=1 Tax=Galbibacter pacificus TaxID=2996052 RepID=A0ABT6FTK3_9FLAO|nr:hypothetical protein [Galbibacter pacificus]MDG3583126.1 hypothetical protein [Galbibacter pacificus]MDG3586607.1 hypothetical protein [Galbibacter pacificus]
MEYRERSLVDLFGLSIAPNGIFIISVIAENFTNMYGFAPDLEGGTGGAADSNDHDNIELVDGNGKVVDVFGVPGENRRAVRRSEVVKTMQHIFFLNGKSLTIQGLPDP